MDGASLGITNSNCEAQSGTTDAIYMQSSTQAAGVYISRLDTGGIARLHLNSVVTGGIVQISDSNFYSMADDATPSTVIVHGVYFNTAAPSGAGRLTDASMLSWIGVNSGPQIGFGGVGEGFSPPNAVFTIAGDAGNYNAPVLSLSRLQTGQVQKWNLGVDSNKHLKLYDATNSASIIDCTPNGGCSAMNSISVAGSTFSASSSGIISAPSQPGVSLYNNNNVTCGSGASCSFFWASSTYNANGMWSISTASDTITVPSGGAGAYEVNCSLTFAASTTGTYRETDLYVDGARKYSSSMPPSTSSNANATTTVAVSALLNLNAGDYVQCKFSSDQTGGPTIVGANIGTAYFQMIKVW